MGFQNSYEDDAYAAAYAKLEFPDTYYLAFRDLPALFGKCVAGKRALDFGCGTGRSTRFLRKLGFDAAGVDIAAEMVRRAREFDPAGEYHLIADGDLSGFAEAAFDLILSAFTFDNIPTLARKVGLFGELARVLKPNGRIVNLVSSPEIYLHEWASFSTRDFLAENRRARAGDEVRIINTALEDRRPAIDILWPDEDYRDVYARAGLRVLEAHRPLGRPDEPYAWVNETAIPPWVIYVLGKGGGKGVEKGG
jgi:SAM-dependent methyltransferase